jgi:hypothetical protein
MHKHPDAVATNQWFLKHTSSNQAHEEHKTRSHRGTAPRSGSAADNQAAQVASCTAGGRCCSAELRTWAEGAAMSTAAAQLSHLMSTMLTPAVKYKEKNWQTIEFKFQNLHR